MLVAYLNNPSGEAMFGSNRIKKKHETMKLQNEEVMFSETLQTLINELNTPAFRNFSEKKLFALYS